MHFAAGQRRTACHSWKGPTSAAFPHATISMEGLKAPRGSKSLYTTPPGSRARRAYGCPPLSPSRVVGVFVSPFSSRVGFVGWSKSVKSNHNQLRESCA